MPAGELVVLFVALLAAGFATGVLAGLLGIGGGGILVPLLYELFGALGTDDAIRMHLAVGTSLAVIAPTSLRSFAAIARAARSIWRWSRAWRCRSSPASASARSSPAMRIPRRSRWSGSARQLICAQAAGRARRLAARRCIPGHPFRALYGVFVGLVSTLMSIGGGVFITALMTFYGQPIQRAVATSSGSGR